MKNSVFVFALLLTTFLFPQNKGMFQGGLGLNYIDGEAHYAFRIQPEIGFGKVGIGLDLNLEFNNQGELRTENFNETSDYLSIIRYIRYGAKRDPLYVSVGAIDYHTIGNGSIVSQYGNSPSFDTRKIGLLLDMNFGNFGFESMYSDFSQGGVLGLRGYTLPLQYTTLKSIPVLGKMEVGASFVTDLNKYAGASSGYIDPISNEIVLQTDEKSTTIYGFDITFPVVATSVFSAKIYADYAKVHGFGDGAFSGVLLDFNGLGLLTAQVKFERRWINDQFIPAYFNSFYELDRYRIENNIVTGKIKYLKAQVSTDKGYFGGLTVNAANLLSVTGSYQRTDFDPKSGELHMVASVNSEKFPYEVRAGYDKVRIENESQIFTLDDRSLLFAEVGYKPTSYLLVTMAYIWTFTPQRNASDQIIGYTPQKKIEPRISLVYPLQFGSK